MDGRLRQTPDQLAAELYDISVPDWEGEIDFYRAFAREVQNRGQPVLEVACGTGRVTLRLAGEGVDIVGVDIDEHMLHVARQKSEGLANVSWVQGDMRTLDLGQTFGLLIVPGHSFQFMLTPEDQVQALEAFKRHLEPGGTLIIHLDHQSVDWLGDLLRDLSGRFEAGQDVQHPQRNHLIRRSHAWWYERSTQTATVVSRWEELDEDGSVLQTWERKPMALHCVFRFEMEHLLARTGFGQRVVYGDFFRNALTENSSEMIWAARNENL
jgi:ubiquinone/menaquinone biosynthesis C-methylase UbiE